MIGALIVGLLAGALARLVVPGDVFERMQGATSWLVTIVLGLVGAAVGYFVFSYLLGIGDKDVFDLGGILGAFVGAVVVLLVANFVLRRTRGA